MFLRRGLLLLALAAGLAGASDGACNSARAQSPPPTRSAPLPQPVPAGRGIDTNALREDVKASEAFQAALRADLESARGDRGKLNQLLIDATARARTVEQQYIEVEGRIGELDKASADLGRSLAGRRGVIADVLAALLRMGRDPPPALLLRPDDALDAVRSAILLGALVPELRVEAETLAADLTEHRRVKTELVAARESLAALRRALEADRNRIAALVGERQKRQAEANPVPAAERAQAVGVARAAPDVHDLVTRLESEVAPAARAAGAARDADTAERAKPTDLAALKDPRRLAPAIPFTEAKGLLPLPVAGVTLSGFGARDAVGGIEKGLTLATRPGAPVSAPADGWVVYAGPFRSYGQLLIINAGGGYHILMAGMERITVDLGQFVLAGEPVAVMGAARAGAAASGQPQLYVEFRKDGVSIDPAPWWAATDSRKVRG